MNNWIKFDAKKPETWVRNTDMLVRLSVNAKCIYGHFDNGDTDLFRMQADGRRVIMAEHITHYMTPTDPTKHSDHVSVPRELSEEDEKGIRSTPLGGCYDEQEVQEMHEAFVEYFGGKSPQTKPSDTVCVRVELRAEEIE